MTRVRYAQEIRLAASAGLIVALVLAFVILARLVDLGGTRQIDEWLLHVLRDPGDPRTPRGPRWLHSAALDITALGGPVVLGLTVLAITGYLLLHGLYRNGLFIFVASTGGWILNWTLKAVFERSRPEIVPHLRDVMSSSFPSGHALTSAAVYLTLGVLLARIARRRLARYYCMAMAVVVVLLVGSSRVYLGVHYPSDVLAGWVAGLTWAFLCLTVEVALERRAGLRQEQARMP